MTNNSGVTAAKRRGPKSQATIRAEVEAEMKAEYEALKAQFEALKAEQEAVKAAAPEETIEDGKEYAEALDASPVSGFDISGDPAEQGSITINFVDDGFTALGKVWYRGEELTLVPGTKEWDEAPTQRGKIFALLDEFEQEEIWGRRFFRPGRWRGKRLTEIDDPELTEAERAALAKAEKIREQKYASASN